MPKQLSFDALTKAVSSSPAILYAANYQPTAGAGGKVYPSSYPSEKDGEPNIYASERRRLDGEEVPCVIIDSVQSQANRIESAISEVRSDKKIEFPALEVDLSEYGHGIISTLELPHRAADAYLEHGKIAGKPFASSDLCQSLRNATPRNCSDIYKVDPVSLLFGCWFSRGNNSGKGRFSRMITSEMIAINSIQGVRGSSRLDPFRTDTGGEKVKKEALAKSETTQSGDMKVSELGFGNIKPSIQMTGGVTCDYVLQNATITLSGLRRLSFGSDEKANHAGRVVLASLGLVGLEAMLADGVWLRTGCDLYATESKKTIVAGTEFELDLKSALKLFSQAVELAAKSGLKFDKQVTLTGDSPLLADLLLGKNKPSKAKSADANSGETKSKKKKAKKKGKKQ